MPGKSRRNGCTGTSLRPYPSKIQRYKENIRKESKIREIFSRNCTPPFMAKSPYFAPSRAPTTQGAHSAASWT